MTQSEEGALIVLGLRLGEVSQGGRQAGRRAGRRRAGGRADGRVADLAVTAPAAAGASSLIDGSHIHQCTYRQMALNGWNFQPRKQLLSLTSAVRLTLLSWNIEQRRRMWMLTWCWSAVAHRGVGGLPTSGWGWGLVLPGPPHFMPLYCCCCCFLFSGVGGGGGGSRRQM